MVEQAELQKLIGGIYDAALEPERWPKLLEQLTHAFRGSDAVLHGMDFDEQRHSFCFVHGVDEAILREYNANGGYWLSVDPRNRAGRQVPVGGILHDPMFITEPEMERHEYYAGFVSKFDAWWSLGGSLANSGRNLAAVTVHRARRVGTFSEAEIEAFKALVPHLRRALLIQQRFEALVHNRDARWTAFDESCHAIVIADAACRVRAMNKAASRIVNRRDGLVSAPDGLRAARLDQSVSLRRLVAAAARCPQILEGDGVLRISRPSGGSDLICRVTPLNMTESMLPSLGLETAACIFVSDPDQCIRLPRDSLKSLYGLTPREAQLAEALASGLAVEAAADQLGLTRESARTYLKRILTKTGTTRQAELVSLLLRSLLPVA